MPVCFWTAGLGLLIIFVGGGVSLRLSGIQGLVGATIIGGIAVLAGIFGLGC